MRIIKLDIAGFKSFENSNQLVFRPGITAIVGPNGSGKSNIADAIKWVLGEQKPTKLRLSKSEDVIFHGTSSSRQASMARVSIELNDEKNADTIQISRKLYRSGESELRLNGKRVKYSEVEELLAKHGFGTQTYTVVAQGMIDKILTSTGPERKMLFDEASGIRQYDIRRDNALKSLQSASSNLENVNSIIAELNPSVSILKKQSAAQAKMQEIKDKLLMSQKSYLKNSYDILEQSKNQIKQQIQISTAELKSVDQKIRLLKSSSDQTKHSKSSVSIGKKADEFKVIESTREKLTKELYENKNELGQLIAEKDSIQPELANKAALVKELSKLQSEESRINKEVLYKNSEIKKLQNLVDDLTESLAGLNKNLDFLQIQISKSQKKEYILHATSLAKEARVQLRQAKSRKTIDDILQKVTKILELAEQDDAAEMALEFSKLQNTIGRTMSRREDIIEKQTKDVIRLRSLEMDLSANAKSQQNLSKMLDELSKKDNHLTHINSAIITLKSSIEKIEKELKDTKLTSEKLRNDMYTNSGEQDKYSKNTEELEKLTGSKARIEFSIEQLQKDLLSNAQGFVDLEHRAENWSVKNYKNYNPSDHKKVSIQNIEDLTVELRAIEELDPDVIERAKESVERIEFLKEQQKDLQNAIQDTNKLIKSLQIDIKKQFEKSFKKINESFDKYFKVLFDGGGAFLAIENSNENSGIEIKVNPPGKRSRNINTLSGGEKALAAIALLSAIIVNNPSPFIVLDEVDAALDDDNSQRFTKVLSELSKHCQVILITHNQETMQTAGNLFGITSSKDKSTEILSLALEEAKEYTLAS